MRSEIRTRQHFLILLWDVAFVIIGIVVLFEARGLHGRDVLTLRQVGYGVTLAFLLGALFDVIRWHGFQLTLDSNCVEIRQFWFFRKRYCRDQHNLFLRTSQSSLDALVDKGSLDVYVGNGEASTLEDLGNFKQLKMMVDAGHSY